MILKKIRPWLPLTFIFGVLTLGNSYSANAAFIVVSAQINDAGCDLNEAIESANTNTAIDDCIAGEPGLDTILMSNFLVGDYEFTEAFLSSSGAPRETATPDITSEIRIIFPPLNNQFNGQMSVIRRAESSVTFFRFFDVVQGGDLKIENVSLRGGRVAGNGGAIRVSQNGKLTLENIEITGNEAEQGGAIHVEGFGNLEASADIFRSVFHSNTSNKFGGAISQQFFSRISLFDSTISGNESRRQGGGISILGAPDAKLNLLNTTITENMAQRRAGGLSLFLGSDILSDGNSLSIKNSVIAGNTALENSEVDFNNELQAESITIENNLFGTSAASYQNSTNTLRFLSGNNIVTTNDSSGGGLALRQILKPLSTIDGALPSHEPALNSPLIDAGAPGGVTTTGFLRFFQPGCRGTTGFLFNNQPLPQYRLDQRQTARPVGDECDIGAIEFIPEEPTCYVVKASNSNMVTFCL